MSERPTNPFLTGSLPGIYLRTAAPIIFVMGMNGLLAVTDALFLGRYVGPGALAAVTLMFPAYMLIVALATLVSSGMSSLLARALGASDLGKALSVFRSSHGLALALGAVLIAAFLLAGPSVTLLAAGGDPSLAALGETYLRITVLSAPMMFILSVNSDALRSEGRVTFMAGMSLFVSLSNIAFNWVLIAVAGLGVAGSALGTTAAQATALVIILIYRAQGRAVLPSQPLTRWLTGGQWKAILALGAPQSLSFIGIALGAASVVAALQWVAVPGYGDTVTAYGIVTRVMTFAYLPLLGLSHAMQTITGNNYGAQAWGRSDNSLRIGLWVSFLYCAAMQTGLTLFAGPIGAAYVDDPKVVAEVARILPIIVAMYAVAGPMILLTSYFQAIGDARRAAILGLSKIYVFSIPLTFLLAGSIGEIGIWLAGPLAEGLMVLLTIAVLRQAAGARQMRFGVFMAEGRV